MSRMDAVADRIDRMLLRALHENPDASIVALADATGLSRNTIRARLQAYGRAGVLRSFDRRIDLAFLGYPLRAYVFVTVEQRALDAVAGALSAVSQVITVDGLSGTTDLVVQVVAADAEDLYAVAGRILDIPGVTRTETGLVMRELVPYRLDDLLREPRDPR